MDKMTNLMMNLTTWRIWWGIWQHFCWCDFGRIDFWRVKRRQMRLSWKFSLLNRYFSTTLLYQFFFDRTFFHILFFHAYFLTELDLKAREMIRFTDFSRVLDMSFCEDLDVQRGWCMYLKVSLRLYEHRGNTFGWIRQHYRVARWQENSLVE